MKYLTFTVTTEEFYLKIDQDIIELCHINKHHVTIKVFGKNMPLVIV